MKVIIYARTHTHTHTHTHNQSTALHGYQTAQ